MNSGQSHLCRLACRADFNAAVTYIFHENDIGKVWANDIFNYCPECGKSLTKKTSEDDVSNKTKEAKSAYLLGYCHAALLKIKEEILSEHDTTSGTFPESFKTVYETLKFLEGKIGEIYEQFDRS